LVHGRGGLQLAHAGTDIDAPLQMAVAAFGVGVGWWIVMDRDGGRVFQRLRHNLIMLHRTGQLLYAQSGQVFLIRLAHVPCCDEPKRLAFYQHDLPDRSAAAVQDRALGVWVQLVLFYEGLIGTGSEDLDAALILPYIAPKVIFPGVVSRYLSGVGTLQEDQEEVVGAV